MMTRNWTMPMPAAPGQRQLRPGRADQELPARCRRRRRCAADPAGAARSSAGQRTADSGRGRRSAPTVRARLASRAGDRPTRCGCSTRSSGARPPDTVVIADMAIPGYWVGRLLRGARRRGGCSTRSAGARSATRCRPHSARPRSGRPSSSCAVTADSCSRSASWPRSSEQRLPVVVLLVDDGGLRHAALRPAAGR